MLLGSQRSQHTISYETFGLSYGCGCTCRRNPPYLQCFGLGLLQNIAIYMLLGGQCSQTPSFTQHLPSHTGVAVSVVGIRGQPKVSLFTTFWARAAPKHRYLHAFEGPVLPNIIIYATFGLSYRCGCKCRRDRVPAKSIAIYSQQSLWGWVLV